MENDSFNGSRFVASLGAKQSIDESEFWLTRGDESVLLQLQNWNFEAPSSESLPHITIYPEKKFQTVDGFGYALTGASADLIYLLPDSVQESLLKELFLNEDPSIGISYLRISMGSSDLNSEVFSYDDLPAGQKSDLELKNFTLKQDLKSLVPVLKKIVKLNPKIKILASPWSAPRWMKTNKSFIAGKLNPIYYSIYAQYFVKYIRAMEAQGISIEAVTLQNEPLNPDNNPSMIMQASEARDFVKNHLGPIFKKEALKTKIIVWDHNCDLPEYPLTILKDPKAAEFIDGSAFHLYAGDPSSLSKVHIAYPSKNVYVTEQWVGGPSNFDGDLNWHVKNMIIESMRNWSKSVLERNLAADSQYGPHTVGGCKNCLGALTIDSNSTGPSKSSITRNVSYYVIAHASKFVPQGSWRVASESSLDTLSNVAFQTPGGKNVLIVLNEKKEAQDFQIDFEKKQRRAILPARSVGTFVWRDF
ncbi:MAG: glycoside hydrolase family 30 protein [Bacteriovorax sp.]